MHSDRGGQYCGKAYYKLSRLTGPHQDALHVHEEVVSVEGGVTEVVMRCTSCMSIWPHLLIDYATCTWQLLVVASVQLQVAGWP